MSLETKSTTSLNDQGNSFLSCIAEATELLSFSERTASPWVTIYEAERYAHVSHGVISDAIKCGELPGYRRSGGKTTLVNVREIDEWIASWRIQPEALSNKAGEVR
jgi:hypothetical protein